MSLVEKCISPLRDFNQRVQLILRENIYALSKKCYKYTFKHMTAGIAKSQTLSDLAIIGS